MLLRKKWLRIMAMAVICPTLLVACGKYAAKGPRTTELICYKSAGELAQMIRNGDITSLELLDGYIDRIERYNRDINAVVATDYDAARKRAMAADTALANGENWGPLHGVPMTVKDLLEVQGMPTTSGDPLLKAYVPQKNAVAVQRLVDAGAIIFGKTNVPFHGEDIQSFNAVYGTTNNPWDLKRTPGGSSGGSTAALAAGLTPLELGSDLGGSLRIPAHFCGVYGHKPTFGIVPRYGHIPPMPLSVPEQFMPNIPLFVVGPLARSAEDLDLALQIVAGGGATAAGQNASLLNPSKKERIEDFRVAVVIDGTAPHEQLDAQVRARLEKTIQALSAAGVHIDRTARPNITSYEILETYKAVYQCTMSRKLPLPKEVADRQKHLMAVMAEFFKDYDVMLTPVTPTVAFAHNHTGTVESRQIIINGEKCSGLWNMAWTLLAVASGLPATAAPVGLSEQGLPVGIQIIGAQYEDRTTIAFAGELSKLTGGFKIPPGYEK